MSHSTPDARRTHIKVCGLTRPSDVEHALLAGVDMLGFVFDRGPCKVSPQAVRGLLTLARDADPSVMCVAVVGALPPGSIAAVRTLQFDAMQMEASAYDAACDDRAWSLPAFFDDGQLFRRVQAFRKAHAPRFGRDPCDPLRGLVNVDGRGGGGTGKRADWHAAQDLARQGPLMLAGGLTADNVQSAIAHVRPAAVDVSSGIEEAPGRKDRGKLHDFVAAVRAVDRG